MATPADIAAEDGKITRAQEAAEAEAGEPPPPSEELQNLNYELLLLGLSILSVVNIGIQLIARDPTVDGIIDIINIPLTVIFFIDFLIRMRSADSPREYFFRQFGWADLLASVPLPALKILRLFRVFRAARLIRTFGFRNLLREVAENRADAALAVITFCIITVLEFGAMAIIAAERTSPDANIKNASDAIWWAFVSITTVGYGDRYPVTNWGRFVGVIVLMTGVGLFGVLTGYLANAFLAPGKSKEEAEPPPAPPAAATPDTQTMLAEIQGLRAAQQQAQAALAAIQAHLAAQEAAHAELRALVAELKER